MSQLKVNSIVPVGGLPSGANGGIIQIVQTVKTDTFSQSSLNDSTFSNDTGLNVTITPSSISNKIRLTGSAVVSMGQVHDGIGIGLFKGSNVISNALGDAAGNRTQCMTMHFMGQYGGQCNNLAFDFTDSPSTTSATTYGIRIIFFSSTASSTVYLNRSQADDNQVYRPRSISTITAMEVTA